jgi:hypothetical protein
VSSDERVEADIGLPRATIPCQSVMPHRLGAATVPLWPRRDIGPPVTKHALLPSGSAGDEISDGAITPPMTTNRSIGTQGIRAPAHLARSDPVLAMERATERGL